MSNITIRKVGIIGAGVMGSQIAEVMAFNNLEVVLKDVSQSFLERSKQMINTYLSSLVNYQTTRADKEISSLEKQFGIRLTDEQKNAIRLKLKPEIDANIGQTILSRIRFALDWRDFKEADLVIESIPEEIGLKKKLFQEIEDVVSDSAIIGTNTSTLSITELASMYSRPEKCIGTHFVNPVWTLPLIEVVRAFRTEQEIFDSTMRFLSGLQNHRGAMKPMAVKEVPGFVANRIMRAMWNEACSLYEQGVASYEEIDQIMKLGVGLRLGPFEMADFAGIDIAYHIDKNIHDMEGGNVTTKSPQILKKLYLSGMLGRKTGRGFYKY